MLMFLLVFSVAMMLFINSHLYDIKEKLSSIQDELESISSIASEFVDEE